MLFRVAAVVVNRVVVVVVGLWVVVVVGFMVVVVVVPFPASYKITRDLFVGFMVDVDVWYARQTHKPRITTVVMECFIIFINLAYYIFSIFFLGNFFGILTFF